MFWSIFLQCSALIAAMVCVGGIIARFSRR
jgi:hypothetical protein